MSEVIDSNSKKSVNSFKEIFQFLLKALFCGWNGFQNVIIPQDILLFTSGISFYHFLEKQVIFYPQNLSLILMISCCFLFIWQFLSTYFEIDYINKKKNIVYGYRMNKDDKLNHSIFYSGITSLIWIMIILLVYSISSFFKVNIIEILFPRGGNYSVIKYLYITLLIVSVITNKYFIHQIIFLWEGESEYKSIIKVFYNISRYPKVFFRLMLYFIIAIVSSYLLYKLIICNILYILKALNFDFYSILIPEVSYNHQILYLIPRFIYIFCISGIIYYPFIKWFRTKLVEFEVDEHYFIYLKRRKKDIDKISC